MRKEMYKIIKFLYKNGWKVWLFRDKNIAFFWEKECLSKGVWGSTDGVIFYKAL